MILRLGVVGNQYFGWDNGATRGKDWAVDEDPEKIRREVEARCLEVFEAVQACMKSVHIEDQERKFAARQASLVQRVFGWTSCFFGTRRLWNAKTPKDDASAFKADDPELQVLTGLGDGVDAIAADIARLIKCRVLHVSHLVEGVPLLALDVGVLPEKPKLGAEEQPREAARGLAGIERERKEVLRAQSAALRHHGDVLMAVWDPDADAKEGGTVESVLAALSENIPVIAVRFGMSQNGPQATIQVLKHVRDLHAPPVPEWKEGLMDVLRQILEFPNDLAETIHDDHAEEKGDYHALSAYHRFLSKDRFPRPWPGVFWQDLLALTKKAELEALTKAPAGHDAEPALPDESLRVVMERAQEMSQAFGEAHRGGILLSYSLAAMAVMLAVTGHLWHASDLYCCILEVAVVLLMAVLAAQSKWQDWHNAYTDARLLAEALRMTEFLWPLGLHTPIPKLPHYLKRHDHLRLPQQPWTVWYFRALMRMLPLHGGRATPAKNTKEMAKHLSENWIASQIRHHVRNAARHGHVHHLAEGFRVVFFALAVVAVLLHAVHVLEKVVSHQEGQSKAPDAVAQCEAEKHAKAEVEHCSWMPDSSWLFFFCVCMPAAIAAVHGMASQLESSRLRLRSKSLKEMLEASKERLDALEGQKSLVFSETTVSEVVVSEVTATEVTVSEVTVKESQGTELSPADYRFLQAEALNAASLMIDETAGWSLLYKNAAIPAG